MRPILLITSLILTIAAPHPGETMAYADKQAFEYFFGNSGKYESVLVEKMLTIDTFRLQGGEKVKLIGINSPEIPRMVKETKKDGYATIVIKDDDPAIPIEQEAFERIRELIEGKYVRLELDVERTSKDNKTLAYVFTSDTGLFINLEILRLGYAELQIRPPNTKYADKLRAAYREARREQRGLLAQ